MLPQALLPQQAPQPQPQQPQQVAEPSHHGMLAYLPTTLPGPGLPQRYALETPMPPSSSQQQQAGGMSSFMGSQVHSFPYSPAQALPMPSGPAAATPHTSVSSSSAPWQLHGFGSSFGQAPDPPRVPQSSGSVRPPAHPTSPSETSPPDVGKSEVASAPEAPPPEVLMAFWQYMNSKKA
jgi:hypothetical protein